MTAILACSFCGSKEIGGVSTKNEEGNVIKYCWKEKCQQEYKDQRRKTLNRSRGLLRIKGLCYFGENDGFCKKEKANGFFFCTDHLAKRCYVCGMQATHICPSGIYTTCLVTMCDDHEHSHQHDAY